MVVVVVVGRFVVAVGAAEEPGGLELGTGCDLLRPVYYCERVGFPLR